MKSKTMTDGLFSSNTDNWHTPQDLFDSLDREFHFDLDPCADNKNHKCQKYFTKEDDGLTKNWGGAECSVIHLMADKLESGSRSLLKKHRSETRLLSC